MIEVKFELKTACVDKTTETTHLVFFCGCRAFINHDVRCGSYHYCTEHNDAFAQEDLREYAKWFVVRRNHKRLYFDPTKINPDLARATTRAPVGDMC